MRIRTDGDKAHRTDTIEAAADVVGRNKTDSVLAACRHLVADRDAKRELADYLADEVETGDLKARQARQICHILERRDIQFTPYVDVAVEPGLEETDD